MKPVRVVVDAILDHSKIAILLMVLLTVGVGAGAPMVEQSSSLDQFRSDTPEATALNYVEDNFTSQGGETTSAQIVVRDDNVLSKESLISILEYQQALHEDPTIDGTLADGQAINGVPNAIALTIEQRGLQGEQAEIQQRADDLNATALALREALGALAADESLSIREAFDGANAESPVDLGESHYATFEQAARALRAAEDQSEREQAYRLGTQGVLAEEYQAVETRGNEFASRFERLQSQGLTLDEQIQRIESTDPETLETVVRAVLSPGENGTPNQLLNLMPADSALYEPGTATSEATLIQVTQRAETAVQGPAGVSDEIIDSQVAMQELGQNRDDGLEYMIFGGGLITDEINRSMSDSMLIVGPLALLFVLLALAIGYRDLLDIVLGVVGITFVLVWTFGFMGWADIAFNQLFIAVPVLLIGLSIDYAIHTFMRHREERLDLENGPRGSMRVALAGVGIALVWVTATTVIGFLSNLTSPVGPIREFGVVSAFGIVSALLVFGVLVPALKVELDELLEGWGLDRRKRAIGTGGGLSSSALSVGAAGARKAPYVVIVLVLLVTAAGAYGGTQVDTSFDQEDFLAEEPPSWMEELPEPFKPSEYTAKANIQYVTDNFVREDSTAEILIRGDLARPEAMDRLVRARQSASEQNVTTELSSGRSAIQGPLAIMSRTAAANDSFARTLNAADTDGDGAPEENVGAVLDELFRVSPTEAAQYVQRTDDGYVAGRMVVSIDASAPGGEKTDQMRAVAGAASGDGLSATATGTPILNKIVQDQLLETVLESLLITLVAVFLFLMLAYRLTNGSATLGAVTLLPVALTVAWILGTMYLIDVPFNVLTGMITSLTIGLGVAYSIHISERYTQELDQHDSVWEAMRTAVTGTGGALLGSAATTIGGFGVLVFAILPPLQQFGLITGLTIFYAFLASVLVLPSLLIVWTRFAGPEWARRQVKHRGEPPSSIGDDSGSDDDPPSDGTEPETGSDDPPSSDATGATDGPDSSGAAGDRAPTGTVADQADEPSGTDADDARSAVATGAAAAASVTDAAVPDPTRTVESDVAASGERVHVRVDVPATTGRLVLREAADADRIDVTGVDPEPVSTAERGAAVYAVWRLSDEPVTLEYDVVVPAADDVGTEVTLEGLAMTPEREVAVAGDARLRVVSDVFDRVAERGTATEADLRAAGEGLAAGSLDREDFEAILRTWLAGDDETSADTETPPPQSADED